MIMSLIKILIYSTRTGNEPYSNWENGLDNITKAIVKNRLERVRLGNFGDVKVIKGGAGMYELRINYGPGYRIYFGKKETMLIMLLTGGNKKNQSRDIAKAKQYWFECKGAL